MASPGIKVKRKDDSLEDFEFVDENGDLNVDFSDFAIGGAAAEILVSTSNIFSTLCSITEEQGLVVTIPVKAMATTAATALTGSLIGGVPGLAVGLLTGAVIAYHTSPRRVKSPKAQESKFTLRQVFSQMTPQQKKDLVKDLLSCLKQSSVRSLIYQILKNEEIRKIALNVLSSFLMKKMGISLSRAK